MKTNPHPRRAPRKKRPVDFTGGESVLAQNWAHWERARRSLKHSRDCATCALHFAANSLRLAQENFMRAKKLGATKRELASVAVELMAEIS